MQRSMLSISIERGECAMATLGITQLMARNTRFTGRLMLVLAVSFTFFLVTAACGADDVEGWKKPLREKERLLEGQF